MTDERHVLVIFPHQMMKPSHLLEPLQVILTQACQSRTHA